MKKYIGIFAFLCLIFLWMQFGRQVRIEGSMKTNYSGGCEEHIIVSANRLFLPDLEKFAREVLEGYMSNSFGETIFRSDCGTQPTKLRMTVYAGQIARRFGRRSFEAVFIREGDGWILEHISASRIG